MSAIKGSSRVVHAALHQVFLIAILVFLFFPEGALAQRGRGRPSLSPVPFPTVAPVSLPTTFPISLPTAIPVARPTAAPVPSMRPSARPSVLPTPSPTTLPTMAPTTRSTISPTTTRPTPSPSPQPSRLPTCVPSRPPTASPSVIPTPRPTSNPTERPTQPPSALPTRPPTPAPSARPTLQPSSNPTPRPSALPSATPTVQPSPAPSALPSVPPTPAPSTQKPSSMPTPPPTAAVTFVEIVQSLTGITGLSINTLDDQSRSAITNAILFIVNTPAATATGATIAQRNVIDMTLTGSGSTAHRRLDSTSMTALAATGAYAATLSYKIASSNAGLSFDSVKAVIASSASSGAFTSALRLQARNVGASNLFNVTAAQPTITNINDLTTQSSAGASSGTNIVTLVGTGVGVVGFFALLYGAYYLRKMYCRAKPHSHTDDRSSSGMSSDRGTNSYVNYGHSQLQFSGRRYREDEPKSRTHHHQPSVHESNIVHTRNLSISSVDDFTDRRSTDFTGNVGVVGNGIDYPRLHHSQVQQQQHQHYQQQHQQHQHQHQHQQQQQRPHQQYPRQRTLLPGTALPNPADTIPHDTTRESATSRGSLVGQLYSGQRRSRGEGPAHGTALSSASGRPSGSSRAAGDETLNAL